MPKNTDEFGGRAQSGGPADVRIRKLMAAILKHLRKDFGKDRSQAAAELTEICGFRISKAMVDDWARESHQGHRVPLSVVRALCEISGRNELALEAMPGDLRENAKLGEAVRPLLEKWAAKEREKQRAKQPRKKGGSK